MKTWKKIVQLLALVFVVLPTAALIAVQIPAVQTALVGKATRLLSKDLDGDIRVGKVLFSYPNSLILKDVDVIQAADDTLAHLGKVLIRVKTTSLLLSKDARIRRVSIEDGAVSIHHIDDSTTNLAALIAPLKKRPKKESGSSLPWETIRVGQVTLKRIDFSTDSLHIKDINLNVRDILYDGTASARIEKLTLQEENRGLFLKEFRAEAACDSAGIRLRKLRMDDGHSDINADLDLGFSDFSDFSSFLDRVKLDATFRNSLFDTKTLAAVTGGNMPSLALWINGRVQGPVSDLRTKRLHLESASQESALDLKFRIKGLPDLDHAHIDAEILDATTTTADLADMLAELKTDFNKAALARFAAGEKLNLTAKADGTLADLKATGRLTTETMGVARFDAALGYTADGLQLDGKASTESLQLGRLLGNRTLGALSCQTELALTASKNDFSASVKPFRIDHFSFRGYDYHDIVATGTFRDGLLQADVTSRDPNLQLVAHGDATLGGEGQDKRYRIDLQLDHADLHTLSFDKRDGTAIRLSLEADVIQNAQGAFLGKADIRQLQTTLQDRIYDVGDLSLTSILQDERYGITFESSVAQAVYEGNLFITGFIGRIAQLVKEDHLSPLFGGMQSRNEALRSPEDFGSFQLRTLELQPLLDFFAPDLYVSRESSIGLHLLDNEIQGTVSSELTAWGNTILRNIQGRYFTKGEHLRADFDVDRLQAGGLTAENLTLDAMADSARIDLQAGFRNEDGSGNRADLHAQLAFSDPAKEDYPVRADILSSTLAVAGNEWEISPATIYYKEKDIRIDGFSLVSGEQSLTADGVVGTRMTDVIRIRLNDFDLGLVNAFLSTPLNLQGLLTGQGEAFALLGPQKGILLNLQGHQLSAADIPLGDLRIASRWDDKKKQFNFLANNTLDGRNPLYATASLRPSDKQVQADLRLDRLQIGILEPFLSGLAGDLGGSVSGQVKASGPLGRLSVTSSGTRFNDLKFKLLFTQVDYIADGPFTLGNAGVTFDDITLRDTFGHTGRLSGGIPYDHFKDLRLNARIDLQNVLVLNTTSRDNDSFYGKAFANGNVRLSGPLDKIRLSLNLTPQQNTTIHIPLGKSTRSTKSLLTFINQEEKKIGLYDSLVLAKQRIKEKKGGSGTELSVNLRLNATPDAEIQLEIDRSTGDILKARGNGQIGINVNGENFEIKGDYRVDSGSYHFGMLGFTARDFSINPGGTIAFVGDVMQSDLDLTATYRTKASISPLMADSTAVSTRRTVDCGIGLSGKLANPEIKFSIDIPDLDPTTQGRIQSALNTEDKRMKQALALLVSGGFVPDEQSGIVNNTTLLYSNASEMMASQLNNIFRQLDIPIDLGFNYQPSETGRDIFDVAVSTQLFNNRVSINGNIGNRQYISSSSSDIVGDLDIEIKINRQGQLRLTLFSHSADQYSNYLDLSQRNGAGIVYQEDFNTIAELWRKIFHSKKKNERQTLPDSYPAGRPRP